VVRAASAPSAVGNFHTVKLDIRSPFLRGADSGTPWVGRRRPPPAGGGPSSLGPPLAGGWRRVGGGGAELPGPSADFIEPGVDRHELRSHRIPLLAPLAAAPDGRGEQARHHGGRGRGG